MEVTKPCEFIGFGAGLPFDRYVGLPSELGHPAGSRSPPTAAPQAGHRSVDTPGESPRLTKPYKFIGFGAVDITKPYKFIGFGAIDITKPYKFIGFVAFRYPAAV